MANMEYCAFENTAADLQQCLSMLDEADNEDLTLEEFIASRSSDYERAGVRRVIQLAQDILDLAEAMERF